MNKEKKVLKVLKELLFYGGLVLLVLNAFCIKRGSGNQPLMIGGYSAMTVLTGSMQDVYPQDSLIITKTVDTAELEIGDDITFMTGETSSVTHRIIDIIDDYYEAGERGFRTKGIMNENADQEIVAARNVVGRVVFCSPILGKTVTFITNNWPLILFYVFVLAALVAFLEWNARRYEPAKEGE